MYTIFQNIQIGLSFKRLLKHIIAGMLIKQKLVRCFSGGELKYSFFLLNWQTFSFIFVYYVAGRFQIFQQNLKLIEQRNKKGTENHGINKYADIHVREFNRQTKGYKPRRRSTQEIAKRSIYLDFGHINNTLATTKAIDWRSKGAVSAVKNQGQCGSCCRLNLFFDFSTAALFDNVLTFFFLFFYFFLFLFFFIFFFLFFFIFFFFYFFIFLFFSFFLQ